MEFRVLGPLEITHAGVEVTLSRRRCAAVLAVLLSRYPEPVTTESVADAIWPDATPDRAVNSARVHVTHLRQALPDGQEVLPRLSDRYALRVDPDAIDATRFADLDRRARQAAASGAPAQAAALYMRALAEWRGAPYVDFLEIDALREEITRLEQLRLDCWEGCATALLDDDRADEACRVVEPVIDRHLTRETLVARLMLALYRTGRQPDALTLFERAKAELAEGGMPPSASLVALADAVILQRPELDATGAGTRTRPTRGTVRTRRRADFIGRGPELGSLRAAWATTADGKPQLAFVAGEAGLGKTSLVQHFAAGVRDDGGEVLIGSCDPDPGDSFQPFPALVRALLTDAPPSESSPSLLRDLGRLAPDLVARLPEPTVAADRAAGRQRLLGAVAGVLSVPARPRLVVIEDVHWAQPDALDMLRHVIRGSSGQLMVLATFRNDVDQGAALTHALGIGRLARPDLRIDLREMNSHEVAAVIDAVAPVERRRQWLNELDDLVTMSAGNPLRLREMLRQLELEPEIPISEITPETVRSLVDRRVRALDDTTRAALHAAAVLGQSFTLPILAEVSELDVHVTLAALERAADQGIVVEGPHVDDFAFAHPLFRNAIYYSLLRSRRARIHMRGAEVLAAEHERAGAPTRWPEIARHLVTARPASDAARTVHAARLAAEAAAQRYAHDEAVQWYGHALESTRDAGWSRQETARLQLALGIQLEGSGELERARDQYFAAAEVARAERDLGLLCDVIRAATPQTTVLDHDYATKLGALADQALAELEPDDLRRARVIQTAAFARQYWAPELLPGYTADAARLARTSHDADVRHRALVVRYIGTYDEPIAARLELSRQIREHARREGLESDEAADARRLLNDLLQMGDTASFDAELEAFSQLGRSTSSPFVLYWSAALRATRRLTRSAANDAEGLINAAVTIGRRLQIADAEGVFLLQMFALRYQRGHVRESAHALATPRPEDPKVIAGTALLALIFAESGRPDAARSYLDRVVTPSGITLPHDNFFFGGVSLFAGVAAICGGARQRAALRAVLLEDASRFCLFGSGGAVFGTGHHWLARLALAESDLDGARRHLAEAARVCDDADAPFWAARARQESARIADAS